MAQFIAKERTYRNGRLYEPGDVFVCQDEEIGKHAGSDSLDPADPGTEEMILAAMPGSKAAQKIRVARQKQVKSAEKEAEDAKTALEAAKQRAKESAAAAKAAAADLDDDEGDAKK